MQISEVDFTLEEVSKIPLSLLKICVYFTMLGRIIKCSFEEDFSDKRKKWWKDQKAEKLKNEQRNTFICTVYNIDGE